MQAWNIGCATGARRGLALLFAAAAVLGGCGGGASRNAGLTPGEGVRPIQLGRTPQRAAEQPSVLGKINEAEARRAIANYRINKKRAEGPFQLVGADLNGDGVAEAMVLFAGKDWCAKTGCSLAIFQSGEHGYRVVSRSIRVKTPVKVSTEQTNGWRDLIVSTGGGGAPLRRVRLRFSGNGYARNAMLEPELPFGAPQFGEVVIASSPADGVAQASR